MKVSGSDPTRRSRGGRRHSGAPGGGVPRKGTWHLLRGADEDVAPIGAPLPHMCEGKENDGGPHADQIMGAMNHVCWNVRACTRSWIAGSSPAMTAERIV